VTRIERYRSHQQRHRRRVLAVAAGMEYQPPAHRCDQCRRAVQRTAWTICASCWFLLGRPSPAGTRALLGASS